MRIALLSSSQTFIRCVPRPALHRVASSILDIGHIGHGTMACLKHCARIPWTLGVSLSASELPIDQIHVVYEVETPRHMASHGRMARFIVASVGCLAACHSCTASSFVVLRDIRSSESPPALQRCICRTQHKDGFGLTSASVPALTLPARSSVIPLQL